MMNERRRLELGVANELERRADACLVVARRLRERYRHHLGKIRLAEDLEGMAEACQDVVNGIRRRGKRHE